jgi:hypothetical protein
VSLGKGIFADVKSHMTVKADPWIMSAVQRVISCFPEKKERCSVIKRGVLHCGVAKVFGAQNT